MALEGKHSPLSFKALRFSAVGIFIAWFAGKLLDHYLNLTLLQDIQNWVMKDTAMPNWVSVAIIVVLLYAVWLAFYYDRRSGKTYADLCEAERVIYKLKNPEQPHLTEVHTKIMETLALHAEHSRKATLSSVCKNTSLGKLQAETGLQQLEAKGLVQRRVETSASITMGGSSITDFELTLAGKEYALSQLELT
jgi:hypothetical protein